jgi:uncharacterized membrane protein
MPILFVAYPLLAHLAVLRADSHLQWLALVCLSAVPLYPGLRALRWTSWLLFLSVSALLYALSWLGGGQYALFIPPVLFPLVMGLMFGETLLPGRTALISRVASAVRKEPLPPELLRYTRAVTALWTALLMYIAVSSAILALAAPLPVWSLFANLINYLMVGVLFVLEYGYRRWRFRHLEHPGFIAYLRLIARVDFRKV